MATKSKKSAAAKKAASQKSAAKKTAAGGSGTRPTKAKAVEAVVVTDVPNMMPPEVVQQITQVKVLIAKIDRLKDPEVVQNIRTYAEKAATSSRLAVQAGASALVYAWACGKLLNAAKAKHGRGGFGAWRDENLGAEVISERTSQRYMKLAVAATDVKDLLEWTPSLRQAYIACGILPEQERLAGDEDENESPRTRVLLTSLSDLQKKLRLFSESGETLKKDERTQLTLRRDELNTFFDKILG